MIGATIEFDTPARCEWLSKVWVGAPVVRLLWKEKAVEAVLEFLRDTRVGCRSTVMARIGPPVEEKRDVGGDEEGGPGPP